MPSFGIISNNKIFLNNCFAETRTISTTGSIAPLSIQRKTASVISNLIFLSQWLYIYVTVKQHQLNIFTVVTEKQQRLAIFT